MWRFLFGLACGITIFIYLDSVLTLKGSVAYAEGFKAGRTQAISALEQELRCLNLWGSGTIQEQHKKGMH